MRSKFSTNTGSSARVSGWISIPEVPSTPETERERVNRTGSCSSALFSSGDHPPAMLPAIIPAMAAGPKTEFELARARRLAFSGVCGADVVVSKTADSPPPGVWGRSVLDSSRDLDALRDRGKNDCRGCCNLYASSDIRPPRIFLRKVNSSRISSNAGFHC